VYCLKKEMVSEKNTIQMNKHRYGRRTYTLVSVYMDRLVLWPGETIGHTTRWIYL